MEQAKPVHISQIKHKDALTLATTLLENDAYHNRIAAHARLVLAAAGEGETYFYQTNWGSTTCWRAGGEDNPKTITVNGQGHIDKA